MSNVKTDFPRKKGFGDLTTIHDLQEVESAWRELLDVVYAARANFHWMQRKNAIELPFLDADFIYGALSNFSMVRQIDHHINSVRRGPSEFEFLNAIGPATFRLFLNGLKDYVVPLGAWVEVDRARRELLKKSAQRASSLDRFFEAARSGEPLNRAMRLLPRERVSEVVVKHLSEFVTAVDEVDLLNEVQQRATDSDAIMSTREGHEAIETRRLVLASLNERRQEVTKANANLCDALNAEMVVHAFNSRTLVSGRAVLPVLISGTNVVLRCADIIGQQLQMDDNSDRRWLSSPQHGRPRVVSRYLYLFFTQGIKNWVGEGNYRLALDHVQEIFNDIEQIANFCHDVVEDTIDDFDTDVSEPVIIGGAELEMLRSYTDNFIHKWGAYFAPYQRAKLHDRTAKLNQLVSAETLARLDSHHPRIVAEAYTALREALGNYKTGNGEDCLTTISRFKATQSAAAGIEMEEMLFQFSVGEIDGELLTKSSASTEKLDLDPVQAPRWLRELHQRRILVHMYRTNSGALIALDSWREGEDKKRWLRITFEHKSDFPTIWSVALDCFASYKACLKPPDITINWRIYTHKEVRSGSAGIIGELRDLWKEFSGVTLVEISLGECTFFADITPFCDVELQAGVVIAANECKSCGGSCDLFLAALKELHMEYLDDSHWKYMFSRMKTLFEEGIEVAGDE